MKKFLVSVSIMLTCISLQAQTIDQRDIRWLQRNPASPDRALRLLSIEREQILETGTYNVEPYQEPTLSQIVPSKQHLQYFYEGQRELFEKHMAGNADFKELRARYQRLYDMDDPAYQTEAEYYLGYIDYAEGHYNSAMQHFQALPNEDKYAYTVPFYKMQIYYAQGNYVQALSICQNIEGRIYLTEEQNNESTRIQAECLLQLGRTQEALIKYREYLGKVNTPISSTAYNAAVLEYQNKQYAAAAQYASQATISDQAQLAQLAYMLVGECQLQMQQLQQARLAFEQASHGIDEQINESASFNVCSIVHATNNALWGDEIQLLEAFLNTYPTSQYADRVSAYLSEVYTTTRNYTAALASINKIRQPNDQLLQAKQRLLYQLAVQEYVNGQYQSAEQRFSECVGMGPLMPSTQAEAFFWRGETRYRLQNYAGATADYRQFLGLANAPTHLKAADYYSLGYAYLKQGLYADGITAFSNFALQPGVTANPDIYYDGLLRLADCYYYTRQFSAAEETYRSVSQNFGSQSDYALYQEGLMLGLQKKYGNKQEVLDALIARYPQSDFVPQAWLDKGRTALLQNNNPEAIRCFQQIIDNHADSHVAPQAAVQLAMTYNNMGQTEAAQRIYEMVAQRYPNTDAAATAAEDLRLLAIQQRIASMPILYTEGKYQELIDTYQQLEQQNVDFRDRQSMQLLCGKAYLQLKQYSPATSMLQEASQDLRTAAGTEAKYLLAQMAYDQDQTAQSQTLVSELIQSGTPHQYWLARAVILLSDLYQKQGETFTATEYLKSLKQKYNGQNDDIAELIKTRLEALEPKNDDLQPTIPATETSVTETGN